MDAAQGNFGSTQEIPAGTRKLSKVASGYLEIGEFANADTRAGYFCYNCSYFVEPSHCAIVTDEGQDIYGKVSGIIAPHGICGLWDADEEKVR